jgi:hypothetical protein
VTRHRIAHTREQIAAIIPGGVPDIRTRAKLISELVSLVQEMPEVDPEAQDEIVTAAARAIFADGLMLDIDREMPLVDRWIEFFRQQMEVSENTTEEERRNDGLGSPEFYSGALEGLQSLRKDLIGKPYGHTA